MDFTICLGDLEVAVNRLIAVELDVYGLYRFLWGRDFFVGVESMDRVGYWYFGRLLYFFLFYTYILSTGFYRFS